MNDKIKRQSYSFMAYNLVAFSIIFTLFGLILYNQVQNYLYEPIGETLDSTRQNIEGNPEYVERQLSADYTKFIDDYKKKNEPRSEDGPKDGPPQEDGPPPDSQRGGESFRTPPDVPMRIQTIIRDADSGEVLNTQTLGHLYFEGYLLDIPVAGEEALDTVVQFEMDTALYASLTFAQQDHNGRMYHIQLIMNVDGERTILENLVRLLVFCVVVFVLLSLLASFVLAKKSMQPIVRAWNRQTEFVENASHELRTPLTIIQNKLESMLMKPQSTVMEQAGDIGVSLAETRRLSKLTADLMTLARADSNETQLEKEQFPLDELIETVCEPYVELAEVQDKAMNLSLGYKRELFADKARVHELMVILLDNALKYTGEGDTITVRTEYRDGKAVIEVADTGIGISEDALRRVFDRFYRADKARSRAHGGSGLGLSIAKWIVDVHDGSIGALPGEGKGTVMRVRLPTGVRGLEPPKQEQAN